MHTQIFYPYLQNQILMVLDYFCHCTNWYKIMTSEFNSTIDENLLNNSYLVDPINEFIGRFSYLFFTYPLLSIFMQRLENLGLRYFTKNSRKTSLNSVISLRVLRVVHQKSYESITTFIGLHAWLETYRYVRHTMAIKKTDENRNKK